MANLNNGPHGTVDHNAGIYPVAVSQDQARLLKEYGQMIFDVNKQFNLISRGDIQSVYDHHIAHCLTLAERGVLPGQRVVDWGTGGGLPAIPLAIMWPESTIVGVDSNEKKTRAVDLFCRRLGLKNCLSWHGRAEEAQGPFQLSVSRATAPLKDLWYWHSRVYAASSRDPMPVNSSQSHHNSLWNDGLVCLKGGELNNEIAEMNQTFPGLDVELLPLTSLKHDSYFDTKWLVTVRNPSDTLIP